MVRLRHCILTSLLLLACVAGQAFARAVPEAGAVIVQPDTGLPNITNPYLPAPEPEPRVSADKQLPAQTLSLQEAILLALRMNPSIKSSEYQRVMDKFNLVVAHNEFEPQFTLGFDSTLQNIGQSTYGANAGVSLKTPLGTKFDMNYNQAFSGGPGVGTMSISQPLLRGGGEVNRYPYLNAQDNELMNQLSFRSTVMEAVTQVIAAYRNLLAAYNNLDIQKISMKISVMQVKQAELNFRAGKIARSELTQMKSTLEQTRISIIQQQNSIEQSYQQFLQALGLTPAANLKIDHHIDIESDVNSLSLPSKDDCIKLALQNNVEYQKLKISMNAKQRAIKQANNGRLPELDVSVSGTVGSGGANTVTNTQQNPFQPVDSMPQTVLNPIYGVKLGVPIDDVKAQQAQIDAKVGYAQAKLQLQQTRDNLIRQVTLQYNQIFNQKQQIVASKHAIALQQQSLEDGQLKLKYGRASTFEVTQLQNQLFQAKTNYVSNQIGYLNNLTEMQKLLGITLNAWNIQLSY